MCVKKKKKTQLHCFEQQLWLAQKIYNALVQRTQSPWSSESIEFCPSLTETSSEEMEEDVVCLRFTSRVSKLFKGDPGFWCSTSTT